MLGILEGSCAGPGVGLDGPWGLFQLRDSEIPWKCIGSGAWLCGVVVGTAVGWQWGHQWGDSGDSNGTAVGIWQCDGKGMGVGQQWDGVVAAVG